MPREEHKDRIAFSRTHDENVYEVRRNFSSLLVMLFRSIFSNCVVILQSSMDCIGLDNYTLCNADHVRADFTFACLPGWWSMLRHFVDVPN